MKFRFPLFRAVCVPMAAAALGCLLLFSAAHVSAETVYIKKSGTKIYTKPSARASVLETLAKGTALDVVSKQGKFLQVAVPSGSKGWVFQFKVSEQVSANEDGGGFLNALGGKKMTARESASASSIRGLSPVSEEHAKKKGVSQKDIQAVKDMETFHVSPDDVDRFLANRKLGEYQE